MDRCACGARALFQALCQKPDGRWYVSDGYCDDHIETFRAHPNTVEILNAGENA